MFTLQCNTNNCEVFHITSVKQQCFKSNNEIKINFVDVLCLTAENEMKAIINKRGLQLIKILKI